MTYHFDIDGTICTETGGDYKKAKPFKDRIEKINTLHAEGHIIIFYSGRGVKTGENLMPLTINQLEKWGVEYHEIILAKEPYLIMVDDKAVNANDFFKGI